MAKVIGYSFLTTRVCKTVVIPVLALLTFNAKAQNRAETAIRQLLADQVKSWNNGDIEGYMKGYWNSDSLVFIGKNGPKYGYKSTLANYKKSYPDTSAMGKLSLEVVQLKKLSFEYYFVIGRWRLKRTIGDIDGSFTLLIKKIKDNWLIISDHSS